MDVRVADERHSHMDRDQFIEGLNVSGLMPADIEGFIRSLPRRVPKRTRPERQAVLDALHGRIIDLATMIGAPDVGRLEPGAVDENVEAIVSHLSQVKRRQWRYKSNGTRLLDLVRGQVAEISADLHELTN